MSVLILACVGGLLTILSPCILPVLPFVFARLGQPFRSRVLPMLVGMAVSFAAVGSLAASSGYWVVQPNQTGRLLALVLLAVFGLDLLFPALADRLSQPLVRLRAGSEHAHTFGIEFLDPEVQAYAFTFGCVQPHDLRP
jgi:cytochrome c biogenesis protein CcdA